MKVKIQPSDLLKLARNALFFNALVWAILSVLSFVRAAQGDSDYRWILSGLMLANAAVMAIFGIILDYGRRWAFLISVLYMVVNAVLSITDQFGVWDALILFINLVTLGLLAVAWNKVGAPEV